MEELTFAEHLLGTASVGKFMAGMFYALIGAYISLYLHSLKRDKLDPSTPYKFSFSFLTLDNAMRLFANFAITFVALRFSNEFFGKDFNMFYALGVGLGFDNLIYGIQKMQARARK